ncbi:MAG TPA: hypothetical protein VEG34_18490, partial [Thermoanaerobaculia bacterium]|nr:hypothetical protein [Thermoanaerobaculia bacterium]
LDREATEKSMGRLSWFVIERDGKLREIAPPDPERKQPDPRVLKSLAAIQGRMEEEQDGREAQEMLAAETAQKERALAIRNAIGQLLKPALTAIRCRQTHPSNGTAYELCRLNG